MRRATDPDPYSKHMAGSRVLRDNLHPTDALKAGVLDLPKKASVSISVDSDMEMSDLVEGMRLLVAEAKASLSGGSDY